MKGSKEGVKAMKYMFLLSALGMMACTTSTTVEPLSTPGPVTLLAAERVDAQEDVTAEAAAHTTAPDLAEGLVLEAAPEARIDGTVVVLEDGENLSLLAAWSGVPAEDIAEASGIAVTSVLMPGQELVIAMTAEAGEGFTTRRQDALAARVQRYLDSRGGELERSVHMVRTGQTTWGIARNAIGIPTWVLRFYNPGTDMDNLKIGQGLSYPSFSETFAQELGEELDELAPMAQ